MTSTSAPGASRAPRKNDPAGMRERILDAAFSLFQQQGFTATSVHEIARSAGVTGGALHHHFPTKKILGLAVVRERVQEALEKTWLQPVRSAKDAMAAALKVFVSLADELDKQGQVRGCPVNNLAMELAFADPEFRSELGSIFARWRTSLAEEFGADAQCTALATLLVASYSGAMALAKVEQRGEPLRIVARELRSLLS